MEEKMTGEKMISYIAHESEVSRLERMIKRLWILCIIIFVALVCTNAGWIYYENQFQDIVMTQEATTDSGGNASVNGVAVGDIYYGESETDNQSPSTQDGR